jgi:hypothetical protein
VAGDFGLRSTLAQRRSMAVPNHLLLEVLVPMPVYRAAQIQQVRMTTRKRPAVAMEAVVLLHVASVLFLRVFVLPLQGVEERGRTVAPYDCGLRIPGLHNRTGRSYNRSTVRSRHSRSILGHTPR